MRWTILPLFLLGMVRSVAQVTAVADAAPDSRNGWALSPHGTIRVLVIFVEIEYDRSPATDPGPDGSDHWPKGALPKWKDELFDPQVLPVPQAQVTRYYHDISLGQYVVLGDYLDQVVTIKESEARQAKGGYSLSAAAVAAANAAGVFRTAHGLSIADFDLWKDGGKPGLPKEAGPDAPYSFDHVMTILRNSSALTHGQGSTDSGSSGKLFGHESDTQSRFGALNGLPFEILKHEFNHLLLGGNNFHSGGGNASNFESYTLCTQGGWSMMGAANSSLLTCTGWDRMRLGWHPEGAVADIQALDAAGRPVNADLDPLAGDTGIFILRDFITTGDVMRIRLPFIPANEYQQWLWLEHHRTFDHNGSPTDRFHWEYTGYPCVETAVPGLYAQVQVDREQRIGKDIYGGFADYLRPVPANGFHHLVPSTDTIAKTCPFHGRGFGFQQLRAEPLSGNQEQELVVKDRAGDGQLDRRQHFAPSVRTDEPSFSSPRFFGRAEQVFTLAGNKVIGMGTNPSTANQLTLAGASNKERNKAMAPDNRTVYLNGLRVELLDERTDGALRVRVSTGHTRLEQDVLWSADSLVLPALVGRNGASLVIAAGRTLTVDRSSSPTRLQGFLDTRGKRWFAPPTRWTFAPGATARLEPSARIKLLNESELHLLPGAVITLERKAALDVEKGSRIVLHEGARIDGPAKGLKKLRRQGRLVQAAR